MSDLGSLAAVIADIEAKVTTNGANENTGARVQQSLKNIADTLNGLIGTPKHPNGIPATFSTTTNATGISAGQVRVNDGGFVGTTALFIHKLDPNSLPIGLVLATLSAGGTLTLNYVTDDKVYAVFKITAAVDSGAYYTLTGTFMAGQQLPDGGEIRVTIAPVEVTGVKRYKAIPAQAGSGAPAMTIAENSIGAIVWSRNLSGEYYGTLAGAFLAGKTYVNITNAFWRDAGDIYSIEAVRLSDDVVLVTSKDSGGLPADDLISAFLPNNILIETYP